MPRYKLKWSIEMTVYAPDDVAVADEAASADIVIGLDAVDDGSPPRFTVDALPYVGVWLPERMRGICKAADLGSDSHCQRLVVDGHAWARVPGLVLYVGAALEENDTNEASAMRRMLAHVPPLAGPRSEPRAAVVTLESQRAEVVDLAPGCPVQWAFVRVVEELYPGCTWHPVTGPMSLELGETNATHAVIAGRTVALVARYAETGPT
mgnify:FL=1